MNATEIVETLKDTPYKYTYAEKVYYHLKNDIDGTADQVIDQLRLRMLDPGNIDIAKPLRQILKNFRTAM